MTVNEIINWIFSIIGIGMIAYIFKEKNTVYVAVKDKKNKVHKIAVSITDNEKEVIKKVQKYMKKHT